MSLNSMRRKVVTKTSQFLGLTLCLGLVATSVLAQDDTGRTAGGTDKPPVGPPPNVLLVVCDDLGLGDLACYGNPVVQTPNLDRLAGTGIRFTHYYAAAPATVRPRMNPCSHASCDSQSAHGNALSTGKHGWGRKSARQHNNG